MGTGDAVSAGDGLRFSVLGPLLVCSDDRTLVVSGRRERALLALLLINANRVVSTAALAEEVWEGNPPNSASSTLRVHVSRLRKALETDGEAVIETQAPGYVLHVDPDAYDAAHFEAMVAAARGDRPAAAAETLREALSLWRGPAFSDIAGPPAVSAEASRLEEARLGAVELRMDAELACGHHHEVAAELEAVVAANPLRERLWQSWITALYRCGRQADALRAYQRLRTHLGEELGIEPSSDLRRLEQAVLAQDPSLDLAPLAAALPTGVVTFLLSDVEGSTQLWDLDQRAMADALSRHDQLIGDAVEAHGGRLLKARGEGDSTFSVFTRATDAARAALAAQNALGQEAWPKECDLRVRMALHTGEATERGDDYYGPTVNRAARLRAIAAGGQILVSQSTAELLADHLDDARLIELGPHQLRDLSRLERVHALVVGDSAPEAPSAENRPPANLPTGPTDEQPRFPLPHPLHPLEDDFFVGRIEEVARLERALADAREGKRRLVLVTGEPGVGKTRLVAHVAKRAHDAGATVLYGRCDEGLGVPYQPFVDALGRYLDAMPAPVIRGQAGDRFGELRRLLPELGRRPLGYPAPTQADPETERYMLFGAVSDLLAGIAATAPLVVVIDDLHWASEPTLLLLEHLLRAPHAGMLVLATYRDTEVHRGHAVSRMLAEVRRASGVERLSLSGLDAEGVLAFVQAAAGGATDDRVGILADALWKETGGNPFFVGEVIAHLVESGAVYRDDTGVWTAAADMTPDRLGLPEGVRDVVSRRLSRLSEMVDRALTVASVIGPVFSVRVLELTTGIDSDTLLVGLEDATRAGLLREAGAGYTFAHALIRQTLYDELSSPRRMRMHRRVGEALEQLPDRQAHLEALAHHFAEAALDGQLMKAADYALAAGRKALDQAAYELAVAILERGLQALDLDEGAGDDFLARRCDLLIALGTAQAAAGIGAFRSTLLDAAVMAQAMEDPDRLVDAALATQHGGRSVAGVVDRDRVAVLEAALDAVGDADSGKRAMLLANLAAETVYEGDWKERIARSDEALAIAYRMDDPTTLAAVLNKRFEAVRLPSTREDRLANSAAHLELAQRLGDPIQIGFAASRRARVHWEVGDIAEIRRCLGLIAPVVSLHSYLRYAHAADEAMLSMVAGDLDEADAGAHRAFEIGRATDQPDAVPVMAVQLVAVRWEQGRLNELVPLLEQAVAENPGIPGFRAVLAAAYCEGGGLGEARALVRRDAATDFAEIPFNGHWLASMAMFSHAAVAVGDTRAARILYDALAPWHDHLAYTGVSLFGGVADHFLGQLSAVLARPDDATAHFDAAEALYERMGAPTFLARTRRARTELLGTRPP